MIRLRIILPEVSAVSTQLMTFYIHKYGVHMCTIDKVPNSGLKNPKKCNIWHLPAKFGSTVAWDCMCLHEIVGGPLRQASAAEKL